MFDIEVYNSRLKFVILNKSLKVQSTEQLKVEKLYRVRQHILTFHANNISVNLINLT